MSLTDLSIVVVDDEQALADLITIWLKEAKRVQTAYNGEDALDLIDESVDIVFLDRQMPGLNGDDALQMLREQGWTGQVAMVTAVDPDFDILELDFDTYITKPVTKEDIHETVDHLEARIRYTDQLQEYFALSTKLALLETRKSKTELENNDEYEQVELRVGALQSNLNTLTNTFDNQDFTAVIAELNG